MAPILKFQVANGIFQMNGLRAINLSILVVVSTSERLLQLSAAPLGFPQ